jgi:outer membrane protein
VFCAGILVLCSAAEPANKGPAANNNNKNQTTFDQSKVPTAPKVGIVSFKSCVEQSKIGKQEQANFEGLKKQMESVLAEKEKSLNDMASKFNDPDYLDSLSPEAETELKRKFRGLNQEIAQQQNQYMQTLQQTNFKVVQKLQDQVTKAATIVAKNEKLDLILNDEGTFYFAPALNISDKIVGILDKDYEAHPPENKSAVPSLNK